MSPDNRHLDALRAAYTDWLGEPCEILPLRHRGAEAGLPVRLDLLFFQPSADDPAAADDQFTFVATAGISAAAGGSLAELAEVMLEVEGEWSPGQLREVGIAVAEIAMAPARRQGRLRANTLIRDVAWPIFEGMTAALVTRWPAPGETWLTSMSPPVQVLQLVPLYAAEALFAKRRGDRELLERFSASGVNWNDPKRSCLPLLDDNLGTS
ncbi:MAG TPA: suppressor of fused domain protein [Chloroflexota bacterium]|nr:suppressor of fused domain protein [Chloroflexota bacterium]